MERQRLHPLRRLIGGSLLCAAFATAPFAAGCASALDDARLVWDEGEGDFAEAETYYLEATEHPKHGDVAREELLEAYLVMGTRAAKERKAKRAEEYFRKAMEISPENSKALTGLARALRNLYKFDDALKIARKGMDTGDCRNCRRLVAVLLIRRGDARLAEAKYAEAEEDYTQALGIIPDAVVTMAIVRARYGRQDLAGSAKGLRSAAELIGPNDVDARRQYLDLRRVVVLLALQKGDAALADELLDLAPQGVLPEEQLGLAIEVAMEFRKQGKPNEALSRMMALVAAAAGGKLQLTPEQLEELRSKVAILHGARATQRLAEGDPAGAVADLDEAISLRPDDPEFKLQKVLLAAALGEHKIAREDLAKIAATAKGYKEVSAILMSVEIAKLVRLRKVEAAADLLKKAKKAAPELPEVHVAIALVLAASEPNKLLKKERRALRAGLVKYPKKKVTRVAEALSELDWSRQQIRGLGVAYPYRGAETEKRINALEKKLKKFYPFVVKFHGEPKAIVVLKNSSSADIKVELEGRNRTRKATVPAGGTKKVTYGRPGFVRLVYGDKKSAILTEPYTQVEINL